VTATASAGLMQVLTDPRTTLAQCLNTILTAELTDNAAVDRMFSDLEKKMRVLHILVNNASVFDRGTLEESTTELWDAQMDSNARAPFFVAQKAARLMLLQPQGKIVNLVDVAGETIWPGYLPVPGP
jgi:NAD(P)-dependent dehydrogenase (short-subunit alcohol dehydrogenase family)